MSLYNELKRRNVIRVTVAYLAGAWLLIEVTETLFPIYGFSDTAIRLVVTLLAIGLPITLILSWVYELTPEGLKLEKDIDRTSPAPRENTKKLDRAIIVLLTLVLGYFAFDKFVLDPQQDVKIAETAAQAGAEQALEQARLAKPNKKSIAVLAFADMSPDKDQEHFSDGLSDTLIHVLTQVSDLKVTARNSSFSFKGQNIDVTEIARKLNVGTILEGSVQKSGNRIRVIAQLINTDDGTHLWSKSFDRSFEDIFAVHDEIAQEVVNELKVTLLDTEEERLAQRYQPAPEAWVQLILGRHEMAKRTAEGLAAAEQHFKQAIKLDPDYALPYVYLSETYGQQVIKGSLVFEESLQRRQPLVDKALELDPFSGEAYLERALFHGDQQVKTGEGDHNTIEEDIYKALELSPSYAAAHQHYGTLLSNQGRFEDALEQMRMAAELDPMSPIFQVEIAWAVWDTGRKEEAITLIRRNIERTPELLGNYSLMGSFLTRLGQIGEAQRWFQEARRRNPGDGYIRWSVCIGFLHLGDVLSAESCASQLREAHPEKVVSVSMWPLLHAYRGEWDAAIVTLESASKRVPGYSPWVRTLADWIAGQGDVKRARRLMADTYPELLEDGATLNLVSSTVFAAILNANGETQRLDVLLLAMEEQIAAMAYDMPYSYIFDVYIYAMRGDRDQFITSLRKAIDEGWKVSTPGSPFSGAAWWILREDWKLGSLRQDPEFIALMNELEADIRKQRQWYEENKDKPLF